MKYVLLSLLGILALAAALPTKSKYRVYKNPRSKDAMEGGTVPVHITSGGDAAAVLSRVETTTVAPTTPVPTVDDLPEELTSPKPKSGNQPVGEPTKAPPPAVAGPPAFPPAVVLPEAVSSPVVPLSEAPAIDAASAATTVAPPVAPGPTIVPAPPVDNKEPVNGTAVSEEDDSSSEEGDEDEDDGRTLVSRRKAKSAKFPFSSNDVAGIKRVAPKNPPLKYDLVINGFVTEDGQVLVPFDTYQKYFHQEQRKFPPLYAITRDDTQPSTSAVVSDETDAEKSSEETVQVVQKSKPDNNAETESAENSAASASSEGENVVSPGTVGDSDEKEVASAENEKPVVAEQLPAVQTQPLIASPPLFRPSLQGLPARLPTNEDDEEEAGRYLDNFDFVPETDYDDDYSFHQARGPYYQFL